MQTIGCIKMKLEMVVGLGHGHIVSLSCSVMSVTLVYYRQTVEWIKMKLDMQVGLSPDHIVYYMRTQLPPPEKRNNLPIFGLCPL